ncbi:hypothetical protein M8818_002518 [Zalaria obscura]|uniref:Uncharacterized protein n=1 Tax=Zalaria obscura TaxID=2024903 RepID=A0ACC3SH87_9PEZI
MPRGFRTGRAGLIAPATNLKGGRERALSRSIRDRGDEGSLESRFFRVVRSLETSLVVSLLGPPSAALFSATLFVLASFKMVGSTAESFSLEGFLPGAWPADLSAASLAGLLEALAV